VTEGVGRPGAPRGSARITVIAGVNGAGKSSIVGETIRARGGAYFNPDEEAQALRAEDPTLSTEAANARAWEAGRTGLERAIARREDFAFETTLGGTSIAALLGRALDAGHEVVVRYVGLDSPERHVTRVRARVARGGHDIPEAKIRERYRRSREHLIALLPRLTSLVLYDNSIEGDPEAGGTPAPQQLLHMESGRIVSVAPAARILAWARPIVSAAILSNEQQAGRAP
jgi:predicted ABC-type ATPase